MVSPSDRTVGDLPRKATTFGPHGTVVDRRSNKVPLSAERTPADCALAHLDVRLREIEDRRAVAVTSVGAQHLNQRGQVQGGVYGVVADAVAGWATEAFLAGGHYATTVLNGQLFGSVATGEVIRAEADVTHGGRSTVACTIRLWRERESDEPKLIALFTCQQLVLHAGSARS